MTHTPGPWHVDRDRIVWDNYTIAELRAPASEEPCYHDAIVEANARLIAAAPTMLRALRLAQFAFGFGSSATLGQQQEAAEAITAAILEATNADT